MKNKALTGLKITDEAEGKVQAVFATLNVIDHDGDVTVPGAFEDGAEVRISAFNHASWGDALPVGKGVIREEGDEAILDGQFFLDTDSGRDTFAVVKGLGALGEWSYGFDVIEAEQATHDGEEVQMLKKLKVHEVSPVILGAGLGTRTLAAKQRGIKLTDHVDAVLVDVTGLIDRAQEVKDLRVQKGKQGIGEESAARLADLAAQLKRLNEVLVPEPDIDPARDAAAAQKVRPIRDALLASTERTDR